MGKKSLSCTRTHAHTYTYFSRLPHSWLDAVIAHKLIDAIKTINERVIRKLEPRNYWAQNTHWFTGLKISPPLNFLPGPYSFQLLSSPSPSCNLSFLQYSSDHMSQ